MDIEVDLLDWLPQSGSCSEISGKFIFDNHVVHLLHKKMGEGLPLFFDFQGEGVGGGSLRGQICLT